MKLNIGLTSAVHFRCISGAVETRTKYITRNVITEVNESLGLKGNPGKGNSWKCW